MKKFKGISSGTYLTKRLKDKTKKSTPKEDLCKNCINNNICKYKDISTFSKGKVFKNNCTCDNFYFTITAKATLQIGRDLEKGKNITKTFTAATEEEAISKALTEKLEMDKNGGFKIISTSTKSIVELVSDVINEDYKLGKIKSNTKLRKEDTLKKLSNESFCTKPISKVKREEVVNYLEILKPYSKSTIKQVYELLCIAFGEATYKEIITNNFMTGFKRVEKPKSQYKSNHKISLSLSEQKIFTEYLTNESITNCPYKYLFLLLLNTGIRISEALVLNYKKDIDIKNSKLTINKTQTKDENGNLIVGVTTKTSSGLRIIDLNSNANSILEDALKHIIPNKNNLLFSDSKGNMLKESTINSYLKKIALRLNLGIYTDNDGIKTSVHTHLLRGTFATRCAEAKIAPIVLKNILGHSDITVTMKYYIDVDSSFIKSENETAISYLKDNKII